MKFCAIFDGEDYETHAVNREKAASNIAFRICQRFRWSLDRQRELRKQLKVHPADDRGTKPPGS